MGSTAAQLPAVVFPEHLIHTDVKGLVLVMLVHEVLVDTEFGSGHGFSFGDAGQIKSVKLMEYMRVFFRINLE